MNVAKFKGILAEKEITLEYVARAAEIDPSTLYRKLGTGGNKFTIEEIQKMMKKIPLTEAEAVLIFLRA